MPPPSKRKLNCMLRPLYLAAIYGIYVDTKVLISAESKIKVNFGNKFFSCPSRWTCRWVIIYLRTQLAIEYTADNITGTSLLQQYSN